MSIDAVTPERLHAPLSAYHCTFQSASTESLAFLSELDALLRLENTNGYTFQASTKAYEHAQGYLEAATAILGRALTRPKFVPDGESGIDIEWERGERNLTLSCRGKDNQTDFIYWEENGEYDGKDASLSLLIDRLDWLNHA